VDLTKTGNESAIAAKSEYENLCKQNKITEDPCDSFIKQRNAFNDSVKSKPHGQLFLDKKLVSIEIPDDLDANQVNKVSKDIRFQEKHSIEMPAKSFEDLLKFQMELRDELKKNLIEKSKNEGDLNKLCKRCLNKLANVKNVNISEE